ncbi:MAG: putative sensor histidine kinase [Rhodospirillales bacterium]|jgi:two-component system osmolarity sensor histidine kinase EnvZ|nr:putative sensor histidine kinase [Rhodospirillales bacterium]
MSSVPTDAPAPSHSGWLKRILPRTLFGRSLLIIVTPVMLLQMVTTYLFFDRHWSALTRSLAFSVANEIALIIDDIEHAASETQIPAICDARGKQLDLVISYQPRAELGDQVLVPWNPLVRRILGQALNEKVHRPYEIGTYVPEDWVEIRVQLDQGVLTVLSPQRRLFSYTTYLFVLWMLAASILLAGVAILFMRNQVRPIRRLAIAADLFGKGREVEKFKPEGASEVRQAAAAFLGMKDRIKRQIAQRTEMLAGVSHDLRTPLTRMKLQLAMLPEGEAREGFADDVAEMEQMIEAYLAFARGEGTEAPAETDLDQLVADCVDRARRGGRPIGLTLVEPIHATLRAQAMKRCVDNLIGNALRYARNIAVTVRRDGPVAEIVVDDDGPGIPASRREDVFRPFMRLEASRNLKTGGAGLGLTIARDIARGHGGDVLLSDSPMGGLRARVRLPL